MKCAKEDHVLLQQKLITFLLKSRTMPHSLTNETTAKLLLGHNIRTRLSLIKPDLSARVSSGQDQMKISNRSGIREFNEGPERYGPRLQKCWTQLRPQLRYRTGSLSYTVDTGHGTFWRRHADQLRLKTSDPEINREIPDPEPCVLTIPISSGKSSIHQNQSKSPVVSIKTRVPTAVTKVPTSNERRYTQRERRPPQKLNL